MARIICIINGEVSEGLQNALMKIDAEDREIHIYTNMQLKKNLPNEILRLTAKNGYQKNSEFWFLTNDRAIMLLIYRIYHQIYSRFLIYEEETVYSYESPYKELMVKEIVPEEHIYKPIERISSAEANLYSGSCLRWENYEEAEKQIVPSQMWAKYYFINEKFYMFEPFCGEKTVIFHDGSKNLSFQNTCYYTGKYGNIKECIQRLFDIAYIGINDSWEELQKLLDDIGGFCEKQGFFHIHTLIKMLEDFCAVLSPEASNFKLYIYSFLVKRMLAYSFMDNMVAEVMTEQYHMYHRLFLWNQLKRIGFIHPDCKASGGHEQLYWNVLKHFRELLHDKLTPLPREERFENVILVLTIQFLEEHHAPTRTALERIYTLGKLLGKTVIVINTREQYTLLGSLTLYSVSNRIVLNEMNHKKEYTYKDYTFPFTQVPGEMPEVSRVEEVLEQIKRTRPYLAFVIGNGSIVGDLCAEIVPTICIPAVFSSIPKREKQYVCIGKQLQEEEKKSLSERGYEVDYIIESVFTFELKKQLRSFTRKQLEFPEDKFLLVVVGLRLDTELKADFFKLLARTFELGTHVVFIGELKNYSQFCKEHPGLREHSTALGTRSEVRAIMEVCDLYVNPYRSGGGFSLAEAFSKGVPGVTVNYGDVAAAAGAEFCVKDYDEMFLRIQKFMEDKEYYKQMSQKAVQRAKILTDSKAAMEDIIRKAEQGSLFF